MGGTGPRWCRRALRPSRRRRQERGLDDVVRRLAAPDATFKHVAELVAAGRKLLHDGDMAAGIFSAGQVQGLIHDIPTVKVLIDHIVADAQANQGP